LVGNQLLVPITHGLDGIFSSGMATNSECGLRRASAERVLNNAFKQESSTCSQYEDIKNRCKPKKDWVL
jgi:hypothetical protein